jgi:hypothetical protein
MESADLKLLTVALNSGVLWGGTCRCWVCVPGHHPHPGSQRHWHVSNQCRLDWSRTAKGSRNQTYQTPTRKRRHCIEHVRHAVAMNNCSILSELLRDYKIDY